MSLFSWLFSGRMAGKPSAESSGLSRVEATRPVVRPPGKEAPIDNAQPANRKTERMARRELLYGVVREAMMRAGVLSASYKFKVLSLDGRGRQFLVMVDLSRDYGSETARLAEIEALIAQAAKSRHDIVVTAVYWRMNEHVAVGDPNAQLVPHSPHFEHSPLDSTPAVLEAAPPVAHSHAARPLAQVGSHHDPIHPDEVAAFRSALAAGATNPAAVAAAAVGLPPAHGASARAGDGSLKHGPQSYTLLTGFEDTELSDEQGPMPNLSGTQYGVLK